MSVVLQALVGRAIFPRTPHAWEIIRRPFASQPHGNPTPAGYSGGSVEKYHYPLPQSWPSPVADRIVLHGHWSQPQKDVASAGLQLWLLRQGKYLMNAYSVFNVLKKMSFYFL